MSNQTLFDGAPTVPATPKPPRIGESRMLMPNRGQVEWRAIAPESMVAVDHPVRAIVAFVSGLDLSKLRAKIQAKEGQPGRPAVDPAVLFALWVFATTQGEASAREVARLCGQHDAYRWICGGIEVGAHTLADFRSKRRVEFDDLLTQTIALLLHKELADVKLTAQDGLRVRANAGTSSFRREKSLENCLKESEAHLAALRALEEDESTTEKKRAALVRAAQEQQARVLEALHQLPRIEMLKAKNRRKGEDPAKNPARGSTTDPDARFMKMPDGGVRPAFNVQIATDTKSQAILGIAVTNEGTDRAQMQPMLEQIKQRTEKAPEVHLVDGGFVSGAQIDAATEGGTEVLAPVPKPRKATTDPHAPRKGDSEAVIEWRARMKTEESKETYKKRASTAERVNAVARKDGLTQFLVRGIEKVTSVCLLFAIAHNVLQSIRLGVT